MSYVFLPTRTANYYPPDMPYLAGLRGLRGLGDYASDLAAYNAAYASYSADYKKWVAEKKQYDVDIAAWNKAVATAQAKYKTRYAAYQKDLAAWGIEAGAYQLASDAWARSFAGYKQANTARSMTIAQGYGLSLPQSYYDNGACLSQAEHDALPRCQTVKGLGHYGGMGSVDANCGMAKLPVCQFGPQPTLRAQPTAPAAPVVPPKPTLRAQPAEPVPPAGGPPAATTPGGGGQPAPGPGPDGSGTPGPALAPDSHNAGMIRNGLLLVAVLGGSYLVYRTLKKPKAA